MRFMRRLLLCSLAISVCLPVLAQQTDVNRYTLFTGFDYMLGPGRNLTERGFETDFGITVQPWLGLGGDFSAIGDGVLSGRERLTVPKPCLHRCCRPMGLNPAQVNVPFRSTTYIFAAGPQFYLRKWERVTFLPAPASGESTREQTSLFRRS